MWFQPYCCQIKRRQEWKWRPRNIPNWFPFLSPSIHSSFSKWTKGEKKIGIERMKAVHWQYTSNPTLCLIIKLKLNLILCSLYTNENLKSCDSTLYLYRFFLNFCLIQIRGTIEENERIINYKKRNPCSLYTYFLDSIIIQLKPKEAKSDGNHLIYCI